MADPTRIGRRRNGAVRRTGPQLHGRLHCSQALFREGESKSRRGDDGSFDNWEHGDSLTALRKQQLAEARRLAADASAALPDNVPACRLMAAFSRMDGELDASRRILEQCLTLNPRSPKLLNDLASLSVYDGVDGARQSVSLLRKAVAIQGAHVREMTQMNLGEALFAAGDSAGAITQLQLALRSDGHIAEPYWYLAMAYADLGDMAHLAEVKARIADPKERAHDLQGVRFKDFEESNSVDTPGYRALRETRFLPLWRKAGLPL